MRGDKDNTKGRTLLVCFYIIFTYHFPLILGIIYGLVILKFSDRNVVPGSTKYVNPGACLTSGQYQDMLLGSMKEGL